ncbi:uncharacterized protein C17orf105 homolog [Acanthaster planci]|uniref:Uncharacterized protein C17orf105 homolog n=1 Tax=Acanthaster planci TaxID=133434 RepID=A0A8B7YVJ2_ACAPL|nr:uncharacterized protein C17orf105 homolog [Acanthaster planci]
MHKSYQSILPCQSRLLKARWDRKYYEEHQQKVREAQPMVDTKPPTTYVHLHLKLKKLQLEEERLAVIERDNRILLEKMSEIMRTTGRVDHRNNYIHRSLNKEKRQRELLRVTRENQEILKRILAREPEYNHRRWQREWEENETFMDNIARYPRNWWEIEQQEKERIRAETRERRRQEAEKNGTSRSGRKSSRKERQRTKSREEQRSPTEQEEQQAQGAGKETNNAGEETKPNEPKQETQQEEEPTMEQQVEEA